MTNEPIPRPRARWRRPLAIGLQVLVGLGLGAAIAEYAFDRRDDGAFPHVNFYLPDPELGVRLEPGASMRFALRQNPLSTIHVNSRGYRGDEWPAPADGDVLVVGDSQVFGLGVDDDATFSARLAAAAGRAVLNAGVPTYGPGEYLAVAREVLAERKVARVVVVLNFVNDPFELERPNRERHAVWDGWAVRSETAPAAVTGFPGRRWLFSRSHAVYALRRWLHERGSASAPEADDLGDGLDLGTPSEGGLHDLVVASKRAHLEVTRSEAQATEMLAQTRQRVDSVGRELSEKADELDGMVSAASKYRFDDLDHKVARSRPGDIVTDNSSESGRSVVVTAAMIREAGRQRDKLLADLLAAETKRADAPRTAHELLAAQEALEAERTRLRAQIASGVPPITRPPSQFRGYLEDFKALCDQHGAELVVVALPIDVQVDAREWAKYGVADAPDMRESLVLIDDLLADARDLGLRGLDATPALRAAEPGAFLDHDIHMTAKGHAALAEALAAALAGAAPTPVQGPRPGLPVGRSFVPTTAEWRAAPVLAVTGADEPGCEVRTLREWARVQCPSRTRFDRLRRLMLGAGVTPATMVMVSEDAISIVTPLLGDSPFTARLMGKRSAIHDLELRASAGPDGAPQVTGSFTLGDFRSRGGFTIPEVRDHALAIRELCECQRQTYPERACLEPGMPGNAMAAALAAPPAPPAPPADPAGCPLVCAGLWGDGRLAATCVATYEKCDERLACAQNDPLFAPACPEGQLHAFASNACFTACAPEQPCARGTCTPWHGGAVCVLDEGDALALPPK